MKLKIIAILILCCFYIQIYSQQTDDLRLVYKSRKYLYGFKNQKNKLVIKYQYSYAEPFKEGLALVENDMKFGYIDKNGEFVIPKKYADAGTFSEGLSYFSYNLSKYGYIDKNGKVVIEPKFDQVHDFKNGHAKVFKLNPDTCKYGDSKYISGIIDTSGNLLGNKWFTGVWGLSDSIASVSIKEDSFHFNLLNNQLEKIVTKDSASNEIMFIIEEMPKFPGGDLALRKLIAKDVRYPLSARKYEITGKTYTKFAVSKTGDVINVEIARRVHPLLDKESVRVIKTLPKWKPGMQNGKPVNVWYTVPINFQLK